MPRQKKEEQTTPKKPRAKKPAAEEPKTSKEKPTFSARIAPEVWAAWKAYAEATDRSKGAISTLTEKAFSEYMKRHPLRGEQAEFYEIYLKLYTRQTEESKQK